MIIIQSVGCGLDSAAFTVLVAAICTKIKSIMRKKYMGAKTADDD